VQQMGRFRKSYTAISRQDVAQFDLLRYTREQH